jgi:predicted dehydrogenase
MGGSHARYIQKGDIRNCTLTAVCDIEPAKMDKVSDVEKFENSAALIRSGNVDAVLIATPHYDHTTIGIDAFENGLHVLVEKPISVHKADAQRLIDAYEKAGDRKFQAMFQMRTVPVFTKMKELIDAGEIGDIQRTSWIVTTWFRPEAYYASGGWRATWRGEGGGVLLNQCPHNLDLFQWLCGMPSKVSAFCGWGKYHDIEVEDDVTAYLEYPNGATGIFVTSTGESPGANRLEIVGGKGTLIYEHGKLTFKRNRTAAAEFSRTTRNAFGGPEVWDVQVPVPKGKEGHDVVTQNFIDAIVDGKKLLAPAEQGIHAVELANAMLYSAFLDSPVDVPLDAAGYETELKKRIENSRYEKKTTEPVEVDMSKSQW